MEFKKEKYDRIGRSYNSTRKADPFLAGRLFHHLNPESAKQYLDIGCGTGNYTLALHQMGVHFIAVDPSEEMLKKAKARTPSIHWLKGKAEALPLDSECVDGILASLTLHHWAILEKGFEELFRVAKPKSRLVIFTSTPEQMEGYWLNHYFPQMLKRFDPSNASL
jgi:ubiquinone/menaquinone biosynthesis C-methylase UbiE